MSKETDARRGAVAGPVEQPVRPVAAHMLTEDGSRHHLRFDVREVERTSKHMRQRCVMLYDQDALDAAVAAVRERCAAHIDVAWSRTGAEFAAAIRSMGKA